MKLAVLLPLLLVAPALLSQGERRALIVADDRAYPPFTFLSADGTPRGITIDVWNLWSRKTGVPVEFRLMEWQDALDAVREGRADAVGGMFRTPERLADFAFVVPVQRVSTAIFYDPLVSGLKGLEDLGGFSVACVAGDSAEELLRAAPSSPTVVPYPDLVSLVAEAVTGGVRVFVADVPSAHFYLSQRDGGSRFRQSPDIGSDLQYVGVRQGNEELARRIRDGFALIDKEELAGIFEEWAGRPAVLDSHWGEVMVGLGGVLLAVLAAFAWNVTLRRRVRAATRELEQQHSALRQTQEETRRSEERFRLMFENAPYAIAINRLDDGMLVDANPAFLRTYGIEDREEMLGRSSRDFAQRVPDESARIVRALREHGSIKDVEAQLVLANGSRRQIVYSSVLLDDGDNPEVLSIVVDVTDRVHAEEELRRSEDRLRTIFGHVPIGIYRSTMAGEFTDVNPALVRMAGYADRETFLAENPSLVPLVYASEEDRQPVLDRLLRAPEGLRVEVRVRRRDGTFVDVVANASVESDVHGEPAFINGTVEDLTQIREAETQLRLLAAAVEQSSAITVITSVDASIEYVNKAFEQATGYRRDEVLGKNPSVLKSGRHDKRFYRQLWGTIMDARAWHGRFVNRRKDGTEYIEDATIFPILDDGGEIVKFVATKRDITGELALESQHRQMQKMEAIGQLTGGVAHDFNNLLQVMQGYTELGLLDVDEGHPSYERLQQIGDAAARAGTLVQQLLLFSRQKVMQPRVIDLNESIANMLKMLGRLIGEHIETRWRPCEHPLVIHADAGMIDQVLLNLCVNARDAMPTGGTITIETSTKTLDEEFAAMHAWASPGTFALLQVTDNGVGMDAGTRERIFEPFFTTKDEKKGTGMGLATVYGIVRQHHGMVDVYSEPGMGSRFRVFLPLHEAPRQDEARQSQGTPAGGDETILLAEDDPHVRRFAATVLQMAGYTVLAAADGLEAIDMFRKNRDAVALVLLDVVMPRLGGKEACDGIRETRGDVPVLFASGYSGDAIHTGFVLEQGVNLLQKPYSRRDLLRTVRSLLDDGAMPPADGP